MSEKIELILYLAAMSAGGAVFFFYLFSVLLARKLPEDDREYMDPLPIWIQYIWFPVRIMAYVIVPLLPSAYFNAVERRLYHTGVNYLLMAEEYIALRTIFMCFCMGLGWSCYVIFQPESNVIVLLCFLIPLSLGVFYPMLWLSEMRQRRERNIIRALPVYLGFITMAVEAGLNFTGALQQSIDKGPRGPLAALRNEFKVVLRDLRSGVTRADAMQRMADRLNMPDINSFVTAMVQAERMGASIANTLRIQAEQRQQERFQRAEKMAMQAPVKMIIPLVMFIFPVTFIILGFPILMKFLYE